MDSTINLPSSKTRGIQKEMKYVLYNDQFELQGSFATVQELRNYLCEKKYDEDDRTYMSDTFDYIKSINWHFDIQE